MDPERFDVSVVIQNASFKYAEEFTVELLLRYIDPFLFPIPPWSDDERVQNIWHSQIDVEVHDVESMEEVVATFTNVHIPSRRASHAQLIAIIVPADGTSFAFGENKWAYTSRRVVIFWIRVPNTIHFDYISSPSNTSCLP